MNAMTQALPEQDRLALTRDLLALWKRDQGGLLRELRDPLLQHPAADLHDHAVVLGQRNEHVGAEVGHSRSAPLQQQLEPLHDAGVEHDDRLGRHP